jgi:methyl-accepting chemotaxis protein
MPQISLQEILLKQIVNHVVNLEYFKNTNGGKLSTLSEEIKHATDVIQKINTNTRSLNSIANKQKMLSLNASIEAARSGEAGVGFAVVAKSMGDLSSQSATIYSDIEKSVVEITSTIEKLASLFEEE